MPTCPAVRAERPPQHWRSVKMAARAPGTLRTQRLAARLGVEQQEYKGACLAVQACLRRLSVTATCRSVPNMIKVATAGWRLTDCALAPLMRHWCPPSSEPDLLLLDYGQLPQRVRVKTHGSDPLAVGPPMQFLKSKRSPEEVMKLASADQQDTGEMRLQLAQARQLVSGAARRRRRAVQVLEQLDLGYPVQIPGGGSIIGFRLFRGGRMLPRGLAGPETGWVADPAARTGSPKALVQPAASLASSSFDARSARLAALGQSSESSSGESSGSDDDPFGIVDTWADQYGDHETSVSRDAMDGGDLTATRAPAGALASKSLRRSGGELLQPLQITNTLGPGQPAWLGKGRSAAGWQHFVTIRAPFSSARVNSAGGLSVAWKSTVVPSATAKPTSSRGGSRLTKRKLPRASPPAESQAETWMQTGGSVATRSSRRWSDVPSRLHAGPRPPARSWYAELGGSDALQMASALRESISMAKTQLAEKRRLLARLDSAPGDAQHRMPFLRDDVRHRERLLAQKILELEARGYPVADLDRASQHASAAGIGGAAAGTSRLQPSAARQAGRGSSIGQNSLRREASAGAQTAGRPGSLGRQRPALMVSYKAVETVDELPSTVAIPNSNTPRPFSSRLHATGTAIPVLVEAPDVASALFSAVDDLAAASGLPAAHIAPARWLAPVGTRSGDSGRRAQSAASGRRLPAASVGASPLLPPPDTTNEPSAAPATSASQAVGSGASSSASQLRPDLGQGNPVEPSDEHVDVVAASRGTDLQIFPPEADFGSVRVGTEYAFPVQVRNGLADPRRIRIRQLETEGSSQSRATHSLRARYKSSVLPGGRRTDVIILLMANTPGPVAATCVIEGESGARIAYRVPIRAEALSKREFAAAAETASGLDQQVLAAAAEDLRPMNLSRAGDIVLGAGHDTGASVQSVTGISPGPGPSPFAASTRSPAVGGLPWSSVSPYIGQSYYSQGQLPAVGPGPLGGLSPATGLTTDSTASAGRMKIRAAQRALPTLTEGASDLVGRGGRRWAGSAVHEGSLEESDSPPGRPRHLDCAPITVGDGFGGGISADDDDADSQDSRDSAMARAGAATDGRDDERTGKATFDDMDPARLARKSLDVAGLNNRTSHHSRLAASVRAAVQNSRQAGRVGMSGTKDGLRAGDTASALPPPRLPGSILPPGTRATLHVADDIDAEDGSLSQFAHPFKALAVSGRVARDSPFFDKRMLRGALDHHAAPLSQPDLPELGAVPGRADRDIGFFPAFVIPGKTSPHVVPIVAAGAGPPIDFVPRALPRAETASEFEPESLADAASRSLAGPIGEGVRLAAEARARSISNVAESRPQQPASAAAIGSRQPARSNRRTAVRLRCAAVDAACSRAGRVQWGAPSASGAKDLDDDGEATSDSDEPQSAVVESSTAQLHNTTGLRRREMSRGTHGAAGALRPTA